MLSRLLDPAAQRVGTAVALVGMLSVGALALSSCVSSGAPNTTTTTLAPTTTVPLQIAPLTGVADDYGDKLARPALIVKIDNHPNARPQAGLNQADLVIEEEVEGNTTRLAAIFHSQDADPVGPVRSTRSTDIDIAALFGRPLYASSGGNAHVLAALRRANVVDVGHNRGGTAFRRQNDRPAPHDLFTSTQGLRAKTKEKPAAPVPIFVYRSEGGALNAGAVVATGVALDFGGGEISRFSWDPASASWLRSQEGTPHLDAAGKRLGPRNVVVLEIRYLTGETPTRSNPHGVTTGEGRALVFTDRHLIEGRWSRPGVNSPLQLVAADGTPILLTPGQTFLELPPVGGATVL